jgi:hypothetical protein
MASSSNYAIKPTPELALRSNRILRPARLIAALGPPPMRLVFLLFFMCLGLPGCVFMISPHTVQEAPSVRGTILDNGRVVGGVTVYIQRLYNAPCERSKYFATSNGAGEFYIPGRRNLELLAVIGDRVASVGVCLELDGMLYEGWRASRIGEPPSGVRITCNLERIRETGPRNAEVCTSEGWPNYMFKPTPDVSLGSPWPYGRRGLTWR